MILYLDASAGVSGDMLLAAFLDLGLPMEKVRAIVRSFQLEDVQVRFRRVVRDGLSGLQWIPHSASERKIFAPDALNFLERIRKTSLEPSLQGRMIRVVKILAQAEGAVHGTPWHRTHFRQLSHVDTLLNCAGVCAGLSHFRVKAFHTSVIPIGCRYQDHDGRLKNRPAPAVCRLLSSFPTRWVHVPFEWTTPTGAALLAGLATAEPPPPLRVVRIGQGAGQNHPPQGPRFLRMILGSKCCA